MKQLLFYLFIFILTTFTLNAQTVIRHQFEWDDTPATYRLGDDEVLEQWSFKGANFGDAAPSHPKWVYRFPVNGPGQLDIEVVNINFEPFNKVPFKDDIQLKETVQFHTTVVREHNGYFAKVACVPYTKSGNQHQRVTSMLLNANLIPKGGKRGGPPFNSVLSDGDIYKIAITESGIHKLSYSFLKDELGISNLDNIDPRQLKIYGNGGGLVPYDVNAEREEDLTENAIRIIGEEDGSFDGGDYILFYAEGPNKWLYDSDTDQFSEQVNVYDSKNYYFIKPSSSGQGNRVSTRANVTTTETNTNSYDGLFRFEEDRVNVLHEIETTGTGTGQHWYGDFFKFARDKEYKDVFQFPGLITSEPITIWSEMALRAKASSRFYLDIDDQTLQSNTVSSIPIGEQNEIIGDLARTAKIYEPILHNSETMTITLRYPHPGGGVQSTGWLDFIQARARLSLQMQGDEIQFRDSRTMSSNAVTFNLSDAGSDIEIWDITNPLNVEQQETNQNGNDQNFGVANEGSLRTFTAFRSNADFRSAEVVGKIENQNLHSIVSPQMLIIYHPDFAEAAAQLVEHRKSHSGLTVAMAPIEHVYNEFSSGRFSPTAIRDFANNLFEQDGTLQYLLVIGDGSFDNKDLYGFGTNFIPVYQKDNNSEISGYPADDYFAIFSNSSNSDPLSSDLSISVGRLPVKTAEEANNTVSKIIRYETEKDYLGDWRTRMTFLGDDEDGAGHSDDAEEAAELVRDLEPLFNASKLFFDLFPQESTPAGDRFPLVTEELDKAIFKGSLITTYLGHGGPRGWAQERVLDITGIRNWDNNEKLSLFITATCSFGDYDNSAFVSAAEELILNPTGGAVATLTTTRPVYASRNSALTNRSLTQLLNQNTDGSWPKIGDVIRIAKNSLSSPSSYDNERKFMLMGDPALEIALPKYKVVTTSLNGLPIDSMQMDTLSSLEKVTFTGQVVDLEGNLLEGFNGLVYPTIFDKRIAAKTLQNDTGSPEETYMVQKNILFKGKATVENGEFTFSFIVPKDINYAYGQGKLSYYAADKDQFIDAAGSEERFIIGGSNPDGIIDDQPPVVEVFMNSDDFIAGGTVESNPTLVVKLSDDFGINVTGNSIGHDLEGFLNENTQNSYLLNDFYEAADNDYTKGEVRFPLKNLDPGKYNMRVRAWDVANNMGEGTTEFIVAGDGKIALEHVLNYPNPFTDHTCFQFDSSLAGEDLDVLIQIYTVSGRLVKTLNELIPSADGSLRQDDCIAWDGLDNYGDQLARGVYLYKVKVRTNGGSEISGESDFEKLVILK